MAFGELLICNFPSDFCVPFAIWLFLRFLFNSDGMIAQIIHRNRTAIHKSVCGICSPFSSSMGGGWRRSMSEALKGGEQFLENVSNNPAIMVYIFIIIILLSWLLIPECSFANLMVASLARNYFFRWMNKQKYFTPKGANKINLWCGNKFSINWILQFAIWKCCSAIRSARATVYVVVRLKWMWHDPTRADKLVYQLFDVHRLMSQTKMKWKIKKYLLSDKWIT